MALFIGVEFAYPDPTQWGIIFDQPFGLIFGYSGGDDGVLVELPDPTSLNW